MSVAGQLMLQQTRKSCDIRNEQPIVPLVINRDLLPLRVDGIRHRKRPEQGRDGDVSCIKRKEASRADPSANHKQPTSVRG